MFIWGKRFPPIQNTLSDQAPSPERQSLVKEAAGESFGEPKPLSDIRGPEMNPEARKRDGNTKHVNIVDTTPTPGCHAFDTTLSSVGLKPPYSVTTAVLDHKPW